MRVTQTFALSIMVGIFVALGAQFATFVTSGSTRILDEPLLIAGVVFFSWSHTGLNCGAELFRDNNLNIFRLSQQSYYNGIAQDMDVYTLVIL